MQHCLGVRKEKEVASIERVKLTWEFKETFDIVFYKKLVPVDQNGLGRFQSCRIVIAVAAVNVVVVVVANNVNMSLSIKLSTKTWNYNLNGQDFDNHNFERISLIKKTRRTNITWLNNKLLKVWITYLSQNKIHNLTRFQFHQRTNVILAAFLVTCM